MTLIQKGFEIRGLGEERLAEILAMQEEAFASLPHPAWLRRNAPGMLRDCLRDPHVTLGAFDGETLVAFSILFFGGKTDESLGISLGYAGDALLDIANFKLVIVRPAYRGHRLQRLLMEALEGVARQRHIKQICTTVHPENVHSRSNIVDAGYVWAKHMPEKYGCGPRELYVKSLCR